MAITGVASGRRLPAGPLLCAGRRQPPAKPVMANCRPCGVAAPGRAPRGNGQADWVRLAGGHEVRA
ncbi:hypothetical protein, partial [Pseudomonas paraeruginosa]|uniref:hypothetical protein n=1 Tax=Pseudomonas paraeruginosa TaxID=2994495 RepID=UPI003D2E98B2